MNDVNVQRSYASIRGRLDLLPDVPGLPDTCVRLLTERKALRVLG